MTELKYKYAGKDSEGANMDYRRELEKVIASDDEIREDFVIAIAALAILEGLNQVESDLSAALSSLQTEVEALAEKMAPPDS